MPIPFHEVRFPTDYAPATSTGPMFANIVTVVASGAEQRVQIWANARRPFDLGYVGNPDMMNTVVAFFNARCARVFAFRLKDHSDYKVTRQTLVAAAVMQLIKTYPDDINPTVRKINKPVNNGTFKLYDNGAVVSATVDWTTGLVTPTTYNAGHTYDWTGEFDVPVRFDVDKITYVQDSVGRRSIQSLPMIEVLI